MDKINQVLSRLPPGTVATSKWLARQGVSRQLANRYRNSRWLEPLGHGAFIRPGQKPDWTGALYALQSQMHLLVHAAGKTALQLQGYAHFLELGSGGPVWLFGRPGTRLPTWFKQHDWGVRLEYVATKLFKVSSNDHGRSDDDHDDVGLTEKAFGGWGVGSYGGGGYGQGGYKVRLSAPERAMLEVCYRVPKAESYEESRLLMEGLVSLRPSHVLALLRRCTSVKSKRLFMHLAESCNHAWVHKLDLASVDFGKGKRSLVKGGKLDPKYQITVPAASEQ